MQRVKTRLLEFLFPAVTDSWLAVLRIGLGLGVTIYSLSLRNDWTYLLSGTVRKVAEALLSLESHFVPKLGWFVASAAQLGIHEEAVLFLAWACLLAVGWGLVVGVAPGSLQLQRGFYTCARRKAEASSPMGWIIS